MNGIGKRASLFQYDNSYDREKFYSIGPWRAGRLRFTVTSYSFQVRPTRKGETFKVVSFEKEVGVFVFVFVFLKKSFLRKRNEIVQDCDISDVFCFLSGIDVTNYFTSVIYSGARRAVS